MRTCIALALFLLAAAVLPGAAQGTLSTQGFGYPPGELSARASATGGALAESDPLTPLNPAALVFWGRSGLYLQYSPEWRSVRSSGGQDHATVTRFPVVEGALTLHDRFTLGVAASTFLDRTWETDRTGVDHFPAGDSVGFTEAFSSSGAITDVRVGAAYRLLRTFHVGVAANILSGDNRLRITRAFTDTSFATFVQVNTLSYSGTGASAGIQWQPISALTLGLSGRTGGTMRAYRNDTLITTATVPKRAGAGLSFTGISGLVLAARAEWDGWSSMNGLAVSTIQAVDGWDYGVGLEARAPSLLGSEFPVRVGFRHRALPFQVSGNTVHETTYSLGAGYPLARGRSRLDLSVERAKRSASIDASEHAWTLSLGFLIRP